MTDPIIPLIEQLEETRTVTSRVPTTKNIISRLYFPNETSEAISVDKSDFVAYNYSKGISGSHRFTVDTEKPFKYFLFFDDKIDFETFSWHITRRIPSVSLIARQVSKDDKFFDHEGFIIVLTLNDEDKQKIIDTIIDTNDTAYTIFINSTIGFELCKIADDLGHAIIHKGDLMKLEYIRLGEL